MFFHTCPWTSQFLGLPNHKEAIFRVIAAILHLGNINFAKSEEETDSSVLENEESKLHLQITAELLMGDPSALEDALCKRVMITPKEVIKRSLDPLGATVSRDGLAKTLYSCLFDWYYVNVKCKIMNLKYEKCVLSYVYCTYVI
ncbi:uncharacterized protein DS421_2g38400 [Arachis hypogaea]|nr:uncharacterized protein DS421_2g38400 [Arachis hypogaea]